MSDRFATGVRRSYPPILINRRRVAPVPDPAIANSYGSALVLVRPDGQVAWCGDEAPAQPLEIVDQVRGAGAGVPVLCGASARLAAG